MNIIFIKNTITPIKFPPIKIEINSICNNITIIGVTKKVDIKKLIENFPKAITKIGYIKACADTPKLKYSFNFGGNI